MSVISPHSKSALGRKNIAAEDGAHLGMNAKQDELRVDAHSCSRSQSPAPCIVLNLFLHVLHRWRNWGRFPRGGISSARTLCRLYHSDRAPVWSPSFEATRTRVPTEIVCGLFVLGSKVNR